MTTYRIGSSTVDASDTRLEQLLATLHVSKKHPYCLCRPSGIEMYIAKVGEKFVVKRMPNTGSDHSTDCDSYDPPEELSGFGQVNGSAVQDNIDQGTTTLKFDFSLSKGAARAAPVASGKESDSVKTDGTKLTLRATLHYLWEEAGFNKWSPQMAGKRGWSVIRRFLLQAAENKVAKGGSLVESLYIPEAFNLEKKEEISGRRIAQMMKIAAPQKGTRRLMLLVGEVKEIAESRFGHKVIVKHVPDCSFMLNDDIHKRLVKRFATEIALCGAVEGTHLLIIATFGMSNAGIASIEEAALMAVSENWIPFENTFEKSLLDQLTTSNRRFTKGLRYNLTPDRPLASVVLSDAQEPLAMYVEAPGASEAYQGALNALIEESKLPSWIWKAGESDMPFIPEPKSAF